MNIEPIIRKVLVKYSPFGSIIANSNFIECKSVETAGTDGENIYYNPDFIQSIRDDEKVFVFSHEICHIALDHIYRSEGKDKKLWNIATDAVINAFLKDDRLPMVEGAVDIKEAINYDADQLYKKLLEEKKNHSDQHYSNGKEKCSSNQNNTQLNNSKSNNHQQNSNNAEPPSNSNQDSNEIVEDENYDVGHDTHSMWPKAVEKKNKEENKKLEGQDKEKYNQIKKIAQLGEKEFFKQNKIERRKRLEKLQKSLASKSHGFGNDTNGNLINITDIGTSDPLIDWRFVLKEAIKYDVDWSYQNAGIEDGIVTAYLEEIPRPETEILLDTSGSIDENLLKNFLRECKNILQTSKVKVGCFDTRFYGFHEIRNESDIDNLPFEGGGGTNFDVAVNAFTRRVENKIIFTDGYANMPTTQIDAIWVVFGNKKINPIGGKVIYISEKQLRELYSLVINNETKLRKR